MPLSVKDGMGAWIKDFQDSNAPQFKGKSDKERREMAMAAYLSAKRGDKKESVDEAKRTVTIDTPDRLTSMRVSKDKPPFTPDPPKAEKKNSDGSKTSPMSRAKQLAKMARDRNMKKESAELEEMYASTVDKHKDGYRPKVVKDASKVSYLGQHVYKSKEHARNAADHIANGMRKGRASDSYIQDFARRHHKEHGMKEAVELEEMKANAAYTKAAKDIKAYAAKSGGIDKKDMMNFAADLDLMGRAPNILQAGRILDRINKRFKGYDTDVRDRLSMYLKKHGLMESVNEAFYGTQAQRMMSPLQKIRQDKEKADRDRDGKLKSTALPMRKKKEEVEEAGSPERYKMIKKAGDKYNKEKKKAERDAMKAMAKDKDMMGENNSAPQTAAHRRAMLPKKVKLKGFGPDAAKGNMGNPAARAALGKRMADNEKARQALKDPSHNPAWANSKSKTEKTVSELKKSTLGSYVKKASQDAAAKAYRSAMDANAPAYNPDQRDRSGINYMKSVKRQKGIARATDKLTKEDTNEAVTYHGNPNKDDDARNAARRKRLAKDKRNSYNEAKSFDQKFRDHLKFSMSKSPAVQAYMKKRRDDRDARHAKQDPAAVKKNYGPAVIPPGTAYNKARKKGMNPSAAADAVSGAFKNKAKRDGKLPK